MKNKIVKNTMYLYLITAVKMVFPLLTLPYLTRILSVEMYGVVTYAKAYTSYVQLVLDFGFLLSATKNIAIFRGDVRRVGLLTGDTIVEKALLAILAAVVTLILGNFLELFRMHQAFFWLYFLSSCFTIFIPDFLYRGIEKTEYAALPFTIAKTIVLALTFFLIKSDADFLWIPVLEIAGNAAAAVVSLLFLKKLKIRLRISKWSNWIKDIKESSIYFFSNCATTVFGALTTIVVGIYMSAVDIAFWGLSMQLVSAAKSMYNPIANSLYPHMVVEKDMKLINRVALYFIIPLIAGVLLVFFAGTPIITLVAGSSYVFVGTLIKYLLPVFVASFYSMLYGWPVLGAIGKVKATTLSTIIAAVVQIVGIGLLILLNKFNLIWLAICCDVSETLLLAIRLLIIYKNKELLRKIKKGEKRTNAKIRC